MKRAKDVCDILKDMKQNVSSWEDFWQHLDDIERYAQDSELVTEVIDLIHDVTCKECREHDDVTITMNRAIREVCAQVNNHD